MDAATHALSDSLIQQACGMALKRARLQRAERKGLAVSAGNLYAGEQASDGLFPGLVRMKVGEEDTFNSLRHTKS